jgi:hypothetical protein
MAECSLYGWFGWAIQAFLVLACFTALVIKRYRERPQRNWAIFLLDVSKQGLSATLAHTMNLLIATLLTHLEASNQCIWYFVNITIDTSLGVLVCYLLVRAFEAWAERRGWRRVRTGEYGCGGKLDYVGWLMQVGIWTVILTSVKWTLFLGIYLNADLLSAYGDTLLGWMDGYPRVELVVVMILVPVVMNCVQFWLQDTFLKGKTEERQALQPIELGAREPV